VSPAEPYSQSVSSGEGRKDAELRRELERLLGAYFGEMPEIARISRRPYEYRTTFALEEISVDLGNGERLQLILKDLSRKKLDKAARAAKPRFLYEPLREIEAYEAIAGYGVGPIYYGAAVVPDRDRYWLFLEKVPGVELWQVGERSVWRKTARWLARFHERLSDLRPSSVLVYDGDLYRTWLARACEFVRSPELDRIAARYDEVVDRLVQLPAGFLHGEFYPSNVLVSGSDGNIGISAVDWEMAAVGPGLLDLAALACGWEEEDVVGLQAAYRSALADPLPEDEFEHAFDCARLHLAIQWLGWAREWTPPDEHAQSWLGEAVRMSSKLGL